MLPADGTTNRMLLECYLCGSFAGVEPSTEMFTFVVGNHYKPSVYLIDVIYLIYNGT